MIWTCAYRDLRHSSLLGLELEALSLAVIVFITAIVVIKRGSIVDSNQLQLQRLPLGRVTSALTLAVFSFVGFESSTTLAREARNPLRAIPRAVILSATISGVFFVATAYCMILAVNDRVGLIGGSTSISCRCDPVRRTKLGGGGGVWLGEYQQLRLHAGMHYRRSENAVLDGALSIRA